MPPSADGSQQSLDGPLAVGKAAPPHQQGHSPNASQRGRLSPSSLSPSPSPLQQQLTGTSQPATPENLSPSPSLDRNRPLRKPSPGLLARLKLFDAPNKSRAVSSPVSAQDKIGRIPERQIRELDSQFRETAIRIERRGRAWSGAHLALTPQRTGESAASSMDLPPPPELESDQSSIISTSDRLVHSDSDQSDDLRENHKFRLPELDKTKSPSSLMNDIPSLHSTESTRPPTPPPKDVIDSVIPQTPGDMSSDLENYLRNRGVSRTNSIYTLSRVSFTNQIQQLTSIKLPDASSLSTSISAIPTSTGAGRALAEAAMQIKQWMSKASEVLSGLDAEDDVDWAAAAGREGLEEVDAAITLFESLITVYIVAIEELQARSDIASLSAQDQGKLMEQMEEVVAKWSQIKSTLNTVKKNVEIAMEWEELWNSVLGEIGQELDGLSKLIFEMEERRHRSAMANEGVGDGPEHIEIGELETIVEEAPRQNVKAVANNRFSFTPAFGVNSPLLSPTSEAKQEDSNLLKLFARMQPLRASLDFLPMRLAGFENRALAAFPSACGELDTRRVQLENQWQQLESEAEALRRELGEDRWVHLFRNAASKALSMWQSLNRSIIKLRRAFEDGAESDYINMKLRSYEEKKPHYPPAIERVLAIIEKGIKDRLTVNGEILRLQVDIRQKLADLNTEIKSMDAFLEDAFAGNSQQLRDSISSILSTERSFATSAFDTPGSSPASSIVMSRKSSDQGAANPLNRAKSRQSSFASSSRGTSTPSSRRLSSLPTPSNAGSAQSRISRPSVLEIRNRSTPSPAPRMSSSTPTPGMSRRISAETQSTSRPRWNGSTNMNDTPLGHNFKPLSATLPSPYKKTLTPPSQPPRTLRSVSSHSAIPRPSPLSRNSAMSPPPGKIVRPASTTPAAQAAATALNNAAKRAGSSAPSPATPARPPGSALRSRSSMGNFTGGSSVTSVGRRSSALLTPGPVEEEDDEPDASPTPKLKSIRPASALSGRRSSSMLPQLKSRAVSGTAALATGRLSRQGSSRPETEEKPRWKH